MYPNVLFVPGVGGSGPAHWQSWMQKRLPASQRLQGVDWYAPVLAEWTRCLRHQIQETPGQVWLVAHSFGCLVSAVAIADRPDKIAGALFVAPADPQRFSPLGRRLPEAVEPSVEALLPSRQLAVPGLLVSSQNDPWMSASRASDWAHRWGLGQFDAGAAGHLNIESGFGHWEEGLGLLHGLMQDAGPRSCDAPLARLGRGGALAKVRMATRRMLNF